LNSKGGGGIFVFGRPGQREGGRQQGCGGGGGGGGRGRAGGGGDVWKRLDRMPPSFKKNTGPRGKQKKAVANPGRGTSQGPKTKSVWAGALGQAFTAGYFTSPQPFGGPGGGGSQPPGGPVGGRDFTPDDSVLIIFHRGGHVIPGDFCRGRTAISFGGGFGGQGNRKKLDFNGKGPAGTKPRSNPAGRGEAQVRGNRRASKGAPQKKAGGRGATPPARRFAGGLPVNIRRNSRGARGKGAPQSGRSWHGGLRGGPTSGETTNA